jgi:hypothetical protein
MVHDARLRLWRRMDRPEDPELLRALKKIDAAQKSPDNPLPSPRDVEIVSDSYDEILNSSLAKAIQFKAYAELAKGMVPDYPSLGALHKITRQGREAARHWTHDAWITLVGSAVAAFFGAHAGILIAVALLSGVILMIAAYRRNAWTTVARGLEDLRNHLPGRWPDGHLGGPPPRG